MHPRYRGRIGQYLKDIEDQRYERYKDRPWELEARAQRGGEFLVVVFVIISALAFLLLLSFL